MNVYGGGLGAGIQGGGALSLFGFNWWVQGLDCTAFQWQPPSDQQVSIVLLHIVLHVSSH